MLKEAGHNLQWTSHVRNAFSGGDIIDGFEFVKNLAVVHEVVKADIAERKGCCTLAYHPIGSIDLFRHHELRDFACGGEKKRKETITSHVLKCRTKFSERSAIPVRPEVRQCVCLIKYNEDGWKHVSANLLGSTKAFD